jgi:hypothetical protein
MAKHNLIWYIVAICFLLCITSLGIYIIIDSSVGIYNDNIYKKTFANKNGCIITNNIPYWKLDSTDKINIRTFCFKYFNISGTNSTNFKYCNDNNFKCVIDVNPSYMVGVGLCSFIIFTIILLIITITAKFCS